jgi:outer membrane protein OmpA-like peptidoglycan-associated protein
MSGRKISRKISWGTLAAIGAISLLGACTQMSPGGGNPPTPVASNPPPVPPGPNAIWFTVGFVSGGYGVDDTGQKIVQDVIAALQANPNAVATIIGRTDTVGSRDYNMRLSHRRADAVRDALVYRGGVAAARVETRWTGEGRPSGLAGNEAIVAAGRVVDIAVH